MMCGCVPNISINAGWGKYIENLSRKEIKKVIFNNPATIVYWSDGERTVVKCQEGDKFSEETGLLLCIAKRYFGNGGKYNDVLKKWVKTEEKTEVTVDEMRKSLMKYCGRCSCSKNKCLFYFDDCRFDTMLDENIKESYKKLMEGK